MCLRKRLRCSNKQIRKVSKSSEQCILAAKKANVIFGMIKRNIVFKSKKVIVKLYKALVRPRLEFSVQAWCPYPRKDIDMLERVQRRATKLIDGLPYFWRSHILSA